MKDKISIKDIAKITGTSITTVSFVINGKAKEKSISEEVIKRIQKTVADLGYKPNAFARGLRTGKSKIIGFLVDDISKPFFSRIATAVDQLASSHGYKIIFSSIGGDAYRTKEILQIFHERQVDGYIIAITAGIEEDIKSLLIGRTPVVFFDRYLPEIEGDYVITDNYHSTAKAANLLLENGYKNIGFITTDSFEMQLLDRLKGYTYAIEEAGQKTCTLRLKYRNSEDSTRQIKEFLKKNLFLDAVIFSTNYLTMDGLQLLRTSDKTLLSKKGLISFDDFEILKFLSPTITAIEQPIDGIAETIIKILIKKLQVAEKADLKNNVIEIPAKLNIRESSLSRSKRLT